MAVAVFVALMGPPAASAQSPAEPSAFRGQVVVLRPQDPDEVTRTALARVTGELTAARFQVSIVPLDATGDPTAQVETVAPELSPVAAFAIVRAPTDDSIAIWVSDRLGQRTTIQHVKLRGTNVSQDAEVLAVDAIELIRVSIAGLWPASTHSSDDESPAAKAPVSVVAGGDSAPVQSTDRKLILGIGVSGLQDVGVTPAQWLTALDAMVKWPVGAALRAQIRGLGTAANFPGNYGSASVHREFFTLGAAWVFWPDERVQSQVGISLGASHTRAEGHAEDTQRVATKDAWSLVGSAGLGASLRLGHHLALALEIDGIVMLPPLHLQVANTETKSLSFPGILTNVLLQAGF